MARNESGRGGQQGRGTGPFSGYNFISMEQFMLVCAYNDSFVRMNEHMYNQLRAGVEVHGGELGFTEDELLKYNITGIKVRIEFVDPPRWRELGYTPTGMNVRNRWAILSPVHSIISAIGPVRLGASGLQIVPVWDQSSDEYVLTRDRRDAITPMIESAAQMGGYKVYDAISSDSEGHQKVMLMTYIPSREEWWVTEPVGVEDGTAALATKLTPVTSVARGRGGAEYAIIDTDQLADQLSVIPAWVPPLTLGRRIVVNYLIDQANLAK